MPTPTATAALEIVDGSFPPEAVVTRDNLHAVIENALCEEAVLKRGVIGDMVRLIEVRAEIGRAWKFAQASLAPAALDKLALATGIINAKAYVSVAEKRDLIVAEIRDAANGQRFLELKGLQLPPSERTGFTDEDDLAVFTLSANMTAREIGEDIARVEAFARAEVAHVRRQSVSDENFLKACARKVLGGATLEPYEEQRRDAIKARITQS